MAFSQNEISNFSFKFLNSVLGSGNRSTAPNNLAWYEEIAFADIIIDPRSIWSEIDNIPPAPNLSDAQQASIDNPTIIQDYSTSAIHLTPSPNSRLFFATTVYGDLSTRLKNWIIPQIIPRVDSGFEGFPSIGYGVRFYQGDPNNGGTEITVTAEKEGAITGWIMNYGAGAVLVASSFTSITDPTDLWITGFRYIGETGVGIGSGSGIKNENLTGTIDGVNKTFTTANSFVVGSTQVYINGIRQSLGTSYTENSGSNEIIFTDYLANAGDDLSIDYESS